MKVIEFPELEPLWGGLYRPFLDAFSTRGSAGKCAFPIWKAYMVNMKTHENEHTYEYMC